MRVPIGGRLVPGQRELQPVGVVDRGVLTRAALAAERAGGGKRAALGRGRETGDAELRRRELRRLRVAPVKAARRRRRNRGDAACRQIRVREPGAGDRGADGAHLERVVGLRPQHVAALGRRGEVAGHHAIEARDPRTGRLRSGRPTPAAAASCRRR